jgi:hypothetical protein
MMVLTFEHKKMWRGREKKDIIERIRDRERSLPFMLLHKYKYVKPTLSQDTGNEADDYYLLHV